MHCRDAHMLADPSSWTLLQQRCGWTCATGCPAGRQAQLLHKVLVVWLSDLLFWCRLVRWDMRAPEGVVQEMSSPSVVQWAGGHDYKTNVAFNCMATSGWLCASASPSNMSPKQPA